MRLTFFSFKSIMYGIKQRCLVTSARVWDLSPTMWIHFQKQTEESKMRANLYTGKGELGIS